MAHKTYSEKKAYWRRAAHDWQDWSATVNLSNEALLFFQAIFESIGRRYGLLREYRQDGII